MEVHGLEKVLASFRDLRKKHRSTEVSVGYSAPYALPVHERLNVRHRTGQAKFLEQPARERSGDVARVIRQHVGDGMPLRDACVKGGEFLLEESRKVVPVDTGFLRDSGFVRVEGGV